MKALSFRSSAAGHDVQVHWRRLVLMPLARNRIHVLAATLFAHEPEAFREHGSAGLYDHGGPLAASMSTISPG